MSHDLLMGSYHRYGRIELVESLYRKAEKYIERDIKRRFGWKVKVTVTNDTWHWEGDENQNKPRYDLYPGMSKEEADQAVLLDILEIVNRYIPDAKYV